MTSGKPCVLARRQFLKATVIPFLGWGTGASRLAVADPSPFSFDTVVAAAQRLARSPFADVRGTIAKAWRDISYDQFQNIRFKSKRALWKGDGLFELQLLHPGFYYDYAVAINTVVDGRSSPLDYDPDLFDFGDLDPRTLGLQGLGFAGFRIHFPIQTPPHATEFINFLGASYFRLIGRGQWYGASVRGLAVDTALIGSEEFPLFKEFWIEKPASDSASITLYALLDSPHVTGAYRFIVRPRTAAEVEVSARLFVRRDIARLGIAPLTSMFYFGETHTRPVDDFRPEVHDSDGLLIHNQSGEWLWRPLLNRTEVTTTSFQGYSPRGFGLLQRDREFSSYQDLQAHYQQRPSLWVQPLGDWGEGRVELVEIPTDLEINDNIVSYWVSDQPVRTGAALDYAYVVTAFLDDPRWPPAGRVESTRVGTALRLGAHQMKPPPGARLFVVEFNHGQLPMLEELQPVEAVVNVSSGSISQPVAQKNVYTGGWRAFFDFFPDGDQSSDLRCFLRLREEVLTETWTVLWKP
ncbi:MAG: glucan biosynthesis protein [Gammaproteobacteria bacterium]